MSTAGSIRQITSSASGWAIAATIVAIDVIVMWFFFAAAARGLGRLTQRESGQRALNRVFGGLFVGVGVLLAAVH